MNGRTGSLAAYTFAHFCVDFACFCLLFGGLMRDVHHPAAVAAGFLGYDFAAFVLTCLIEWPVVRVVTGRRDAARCSLFCNLMTNPALNLILTAVLSLRPSAYIFCLAALEAAAVIIEALIYRKRCGIGAGKAALLSLAANAASYLSGLLVYSP